jgi:competence protein ComGC
LRHGGGACDPAGMTTPTGPSSPNPAEFTWQRLGSELPPAPSPGDQEDLLWQEYQATFRWYDRAATRTRLSYTVLKVISLAVAATVPVLAAISAKAALTASLAAVVVIIEGIVQLFQLQTNWISYRASAEALRQQGFFYAAQVDPYNDPETRRERLATFLRGAMSKEGTDWASNMRPNTPSTRTSL